jgi:hypothetical protein
MEWWGQGNMVRFPSCKNVELRMGVPMFSPKVCDQGCLSSIYRLLKFQFWLKDIYKVVSHNTYWLYLCILMNMHICELSNGGYKKSEGV